MYKFKRKAGNSGDMLCFLSQKNQQLSQREFQLLRDGQIPGFLPAEATAKGSAFQFYYPIHGLISLADFLRITPLDKESFSGILREILRILASAESARLIPNRIVYHVDMVMVDPSTFDILFVYIPLQPCLEQGSLMGLLNAIVQGSCFQDASSEDYVDRLIALLQGSPNLSMFDLEEYVQSLSWQAPQATGSASCPQCQTAVGADDLFCGACGARLQQEKSLHKSGIYTPEVGENLGAVAPKIAASDAYSVSENENGVITVFKAGSARAERRAYLVRTQTGEQIPISGSVFRIGKMEGRCDYRIKGNNTVSRHHADIIEEAGRYRICDCDSTNGTYVNGSRISEPMPLVSGTAIRISTEEFIFYQD